MKALYEFWLAFAIVGVVAFVAIVGVVFFWFLLGFLDGVKGDKTGQDGTRTRGRTGAAKAQGIALRDRLKRVDCQDKYTFHRNGTSI